MEQMNFFVELKDKVMEVLSNYYGKESEEEDDDN